MILKNSTDPSLFKEWLKDKHNLSDSSIYYYVLGVRRFLTSNPNIENLDDYNNFLVEVMIKKRCSNYYSILRKFIEFKISDVSLRNKLIEGLIRPKERTDIKVIRKSLKQEEIIDVINCLKDKKHRIVALIQTLTGVRAGDILRLKRGNVMSESYISPKTKEEIETLKLVIIGKRKKLNVVFLHDRVAQDLLVEYMTNNLNHKDYIFIEKGKMKNRRGELESDFMMEKMNYFHYWEDLKQALQTAGVKKEDFATHDFRRCFARRVWNKYKDINVLQNMLNHNDPKVTLGYLKQSGLQNIDHHFEMQDEL